MSAAASAVTVDDVIVDPQPPRTRRLASEETQALMALSEVLAKDPGNAVQRLVETSLKVTGAHSAGVSLEDEERGEAVFRWVAVAGEFSRYLQGTMPRFFSPCGTVVERGRALVMRDPVRYFPYAAELHVPIRSALLVPFSCRGRAIGTVWVLRHTEGEDFSSEDVRFVQQLTTFATSILDTLSSRRVAPASR